MEIPNSCFAFLGPNGAGKTTIMLMLLGLVKPSSGKTTIFGTNILKSSVKIRRKIGYLPENVGFYPNLTGMQFLKLITGLRNNKLNNKNQIESYLDWSGIDKNYWNKIIKFTTTVQITPPFQSNIVLVFYAEEYPVSEEDTISYYSELEVRYIRYASSYGLFFFAVAIILISYYGYRRYKWR